MPDTLSGDIGGGSLVALLVKDSKLSEAALERATRTMVRKYIIAFAPEAIVP